jgi:signal transduction histidine kinase
MSTAIWGQPESLADLAYPLAQLHHLLGEMLLHFSAAGGCIALYNESIEQMEVRLHLRVSQHQPEASPQQRDNSHSLARATIKLVPEQSSMLSAQPRLRRPTITQPLTIADLEVVNPQQSQLFPAGAAYPIGQELIGYVWQQREASLMSREEYLSLFHSQRREQGQGDHLPSSFLAVPLQIGQDAQDKRRSAHVYGVVVLYQAAPEDRFVARQRGEAMIFAERIALSLQNAQLHLQQRRASEYLRQLQDISAAFPSTVHLAELVEKAYQFAVNVVDVSSMLITIFDRDTKKIYDVFAVGNGERVKGLAESPTIAEPWDRELWWRYTQEEQKTLLLDQAELHTGAYDELLSGAWGNQSAAGTFLFLPMKMFHRVIGAICLTSQRPNAYHAQEIQVLETMTQIVTISIENAKLYNRDSHSMREMKIKEQEARQRAEQLAAMNSALQSISSVLNLKELLYKLVESVAKLVETNMSVFFMLSSAKDRLIAKSVYDRTGTSGAAPPHEQATHDALIGQISIPFKDTLLERQAGEPFFYLDHSIVEELANSSDEGGDLFLHMVPVEKMMMIPMIYQTELVGMLAVLTPQQRRFFLPREVGMLLGLSAQAAIAIREAQLIEELQEKNAELQRVNMLKDEFLVTVSHELRTPLTAISGYAALLKRQSNRNNPQQILRQATKIATAAQQLTYMMNTMTDATKLGAVDKNLELQMGPVELRAAIAIALNFLNVNIEQQVITDYAPDLWVLGDPLRVRQVLTNLLDNAAKYSEPGKPIKLTAEARLFSQIELSSDQLDTETVSSMPVVLVSVQDQGEGITPEDQRRIFEKFVRAPRSLTTSVRGSGLGLFICRRYIEAMGGKLWLQWSQPGEGSMFSFFLPRCDPLPPPEDDDDLDEEASPT